MAKARQVKQLSFSLPNRIGLLADVATALAKAKINIEAICAYERGYGFFMMITNKHATAKKVITKMGTVAHEEDVIAVEVPNKIGQLEKISKTIADSGIDILFVYGSPGKGRTATLVLKTADDKKALTLVRKM